MRHDPIQVLPVLISLLMTGTPSSARRMISPRASSIAQTPIPLAMATVHERSSEAGPPNEISAVPVHLLIWARQAGSMSGATMEVSVDGKSVGSLSNLQQQMLMPIGSLNVGTHSFQLNDITGYMVDVNGSNTKATTTSATCSGQFAVQQFQTYYFVMVATNDGIHMQCQIR